MLGIVGFALLFAVGCDSGDARLVQLNAEELKATLRGSEMTFEAVVDDAGAQRFGCNYTWSTVGGNFNAIRKFVVIGDQYCIVDKAGNNPSCSRMFRDGSGALYAQGVGSSSEGHRYPLARVKLRRLSHC